MCVCKWARVDRDAAGQLVSTQTWATRPYGVHTADQAWATLRPWIALQPRPAGPRTCPHAVATAGVTSNVLLPRPSSAPTTEALKPSPQANDASRLLRSSSTVSAPVGGRRSGAAAPTPAASRCTCCPTPFAAGGDGLVREPGATWWLRIRWSVGWGVILGPHRQRGATFPGLRMPSPPGHRALLPSARIAQRLPASWPRLAPHRARAPPAARRATGPSPPAGGGHGSRGHRCCCHQ